MKRFLFSAIGMVLAACTLQEPAETGMPGLDEEVVVAGGVAAEPLPAEQTPAPVSQKKAEKSAQRKAAPKPKKQKQKQPPREEAGRDVVVSPMETVTTDFSSEEVSAPAAGPWDSPATSDPLLAQGKMLPGDGNGWEQGERQFDQESLGFKRKARKENRFLPMRRRIDRGIAKQTRFAYKGELILGLTASYGTLSSDDTDFLVILDNINLSGTMATVKPFVGYFYRDNRCVGARFGYQHMGGTLGNLDLDLGEQNDINLNIGGMEMTNDSYSFGVFHRSYVGLDQKGRFGLFAEVEASVTTGSSDFTNGTGESAKTTYSDAFKAKIGFNPGLAVYIFPNVCTTVSIGLGGLQYSSVTQRDAEGNETGSRKASKMQFRLNIADINFGVSVHLWDKKK